jgi:hypothetical protein
VRVTVWRTSSNLAPRTLLDAYGDLVSDTKTDRRGDVLRDDALDDEILLVGELVVAATSSDEPLSLEQIDRALGLR